ncbi:hypothetical protein GW17_00055528 [Ensete ventricosum]|nr:hypothetical protein GW17_00055528 [Ensete ventricosum]
MDLGGMLGMDALVGASSESGNLFSSSLLSQETEVVGRQRGGVFLSSFHKHDRPAEPADCDLRSLKMARSEALVSASTKAAHFLHRSNSLPLLPDGEQMLSFSSTSKQSDMAVASDGTLPYYNHPSAPSSTQCYLRNAGNQHPAHALDVWLKKAFFWRVWYTDLSCTIGGLGSRQRHGSCESSARTLEGSAVVVIFKNMFMFSSSSFSCILLHLLVLSDMVLWFRFAFSHLFLTLFLSSVPALYSGSSNANMQGVLARVRGPFTPSQWLELEHQALIYKYLVANVPIPATLLIPIKRSLGASGFPPLSAGSFASVGWGPFHLGYSGNADPEPGRCRRTDGKKWRCSRDAVADQKYCERHINRGRHRSRKHVEGQTGHAAKPVSVITSSQSASTVPDAISSGSLTNSQQQSKSLQSNITDPFHAQSNRLGNY